MAAMSSQGMAQDYVSPTIIGTHISQAEELAQARQEIQMLKNSDPFRVVEVALELQVERMRVVEAMNARDATVQRLSDAYYSLRQKNAVIEQLQEVIKKSESATESENATGQSKAKDDEIEALERTLKTLREEIRTLKVAASMSALAPIGTGSKSPDPPPMYEEGPAKTLGADRSKQNSPNQPAAIDFGARQLSVVGPQHIGVPYRIDRDSSAPPTRPSSRTSFAPSPAPRDSSNASPQMLDEKLDDAAEIMKARYAMLESMPIPFTVPQDTVQPITLPAPTSFHEFLSNAPGVSPFRSGLTNYRVLQSVTTQWCPEREEHGFLYTPLYKCNTNPRVNTAHKWSKVEVLGRMSKPTECFYNKDGTWYYAGVYVGFRMEDLSPREWAELSHETAQAIIKDTLSGRKNTSPQNVYETSQLYAAGALKVAVIGLQCIGFNHAMYKALLDQSKKLTENHWKPIAGNHGIGIGLGSGWGTGTGANPNAGGVNDLVEGIASMDLVGPVGVHDGFDNLLGNRGGANR